MEIVTYFVPTMMDLLKTVMEKGIKRVEDNIALKNFRSVIRERLVREVKFNLEVLKDEHLSIQEKMSELDIKVIEFVFSQPLPLEIFFSTTLPKDAEAQLLKLKNRGWSEENFSEVNLIERLWLRVSIAKLRTRHEASPGDIKYLGRLFLCLRESLRGGE